MIIPEFSFTMKELQSGFFNVMTAAERMVRKNSEIMGAQVRLAAKRSMKKVARLSVKGLAARTNKGSVASMPGEPPLERTGLLKKHIYYSWDAKEKKVIVGPSKLALRGKTPRALERGEPTIITTVDKSGAQKVIEVPMKARPYMKPALEKICAPANVKRVYEKSLKAQKGF